MNEPIYASPCISICALNEEDICIGCYRSGKEITEWMLMTNSEKKAVLLKSAERASENNPFA